MKLQGNRPSTIVIAVATLVLLVTLFIRGKNSALLVAPLVAPLDDIKSQLTAENTNENKPLRLKTIIANNLKKHDKMTERIDFDDSTLIVRERVYTEKEINEMTEVDFISLVKKTEIKLPKLSDIKKIPAAALHRTPAPIMQAGKDLGLIKEILIVHESYAPIAAKMHQRCAKDALRPTPVRALCLTDLIQYKKKNGEKINKADYPAELIDLTRMITDM